jgi:hypothetical protein
MRFGLCCIGAVAALSLIAGSKAAPNSVRSAAGHLSEGDKTAHRRCGWLYGRSRRLHFPCLDDGYYPYYPNLLTYYPYYHGSGLYYWGEHIRRRSFPDGGHRR